MPPLPTLPVLVHLAIKYSIRRRSSGVRADFVVYSSRLGFTLIAGAMLLVACSNDCMLRWEQRPSALRNPFYRQSRVFTANSSALYDIG